MIAPCPIACDAIKTKRKIGKHNIFVSALIGKGIDDLKSRIVENIVSATLELVQDAYGNYVVQHVLQSPTRDLLLPAMVDQLKDHCYHLCQQKYSSNVLEKVLTNAPEGHKNLLIQGLYAKKDGQGVVNEDVVKQLLFHQYIFFHHRIF